jgi:hypothetical protein
MKNTHCLFSKINSNNINIFYLNIFYETPNYLFHMKGGDLNEAITI